MIRRRRRRFCVLLACLALLIFFRGHQGPETAGVDRLSDPRLPAPSLGHGRSVTPSKSSPRNSFALIPGTPTPADAVAKPRLVAVIADESASADWNDPATPTLRQRAVNLRSDFWDELPAVGDLVEISFFPDAVLSAEVIRTFSNVTGTDGYVARTPHGDSTVIASRSEGRALISVMGDQAQLRLIHSSVTGAHHALELDLANAPRGYCGGAVPCPEPAVWSAKLAPSRTVKSASRSSQPCDYMIVYTSKAAGYADANASGIANLASQEIAKTNQVFADSNAGGQFQLVRTLQVSNLEPASQSNSFLDYALEAIASPDDNVIDSIHAERAAVGADLVSFFVYNNTSGVGNLGLGYTPASIAQFNPGSGFNAVEIVATTGLSFTHETGHNLGCQHARDVDFGPNNRDRDPARAISPAAYGYTYHDAAPPWTTVMGYNRALYEGGPLKEVLPYLSNPTKNRPSTTLPMGSAIQPEADNAGVIRNTTAELVCAYFGGAPQQGIDLKVSQGNAKHVEARWTPVPDAIGYDVDFSYNPEFDPEASLQIIYPHVVTASTKHWYGWDYNSYAHNPIYVRVRARFPGNQFGEYTSVVPGWVMRDNPGDSTLKVQLQWSQPDWDEFSEPNLLGAPIHLYLSEPSFFQGIRPIENPQPLARTYLAADNSFTFTGLGFGTYWYDCNYWSATLGRNIYFKGEVEIRTSEVTLDLADEVWWRNAWQDHLPLYADPGPRYGTLTVYTTSSDLDTTLPGIDGNAISYTVFKKLLYDQGDISTWEEKAAGGFLREVGDYSIRTGEGEFWWKASADSDVEWRQPSDYEYMKTPGYPEDVPSDTRFESWHLKPGTYWIWGRQLASPHRDWGPYRVTIETGRSTKVVFGEWDGSQNLFGNVWTRRLLLPLDQTRIVMQDNNTDPLRLAPQTPDLSDHTLTVNLGSGDGQYDAGDEVEITADPAPPGKWFTGWSSSDGGTFDNALAATTTFTMPDNLVVVTANFQYRPIFVLRVDNGAGAGDVAAGLPVAIMADTPPEGQQFSHWTSSAGGSFANWVAAQTTFIMPDAETTLTAHYKPAGDLDGIPAVKAIAAGGEHSLFVTHSGELYGVGSNASGELGEPPMGTNTSPHKIADGVASVAAGGHNTFYITTNGDLYGVGWNVQGNLGQGHYDNVSTPVFIASNVATVSASFWHTLYVTDAGDLYGLGDSTKGELGFVADDSSPGQSTPVFIADNVVNAVAGRYYCTFYLNGAGTVFGLGDNSLGRLGIGGLESTHTPIQIATGIQQISPTTPSHAVTFVTTSNQLLGTGWFYWPYDGSDIGTTHLTPVPILPGIRATYGGFGHLLYLTTGNALYGAGETSRGQLGDTDQWFWSSTRKIVYDNAPPLIAQDVLLAAAGAEHTLYVTADGLFGLGSNFSGQLADEPTGAFEERLDPVEIPIPGPLPPRTVVFDLGDHGTWSGGGPLQQTVPHGGAAAEPEVFVHEGWAFGYWDDVLDPVTESKTITAVYQQTEFPTHRVTFSAGAYGTVATHAEQYVPTGSSAEDPFVIEEPGWEFVGWDKSFSNVTGDLTVMAHFQPLDGSAYQVIFELAGYGTATGALTQYVPAGGSAVPPTVTADEGWVFIAWDTPFNNVNSNLVVAAQYQLYIPPIDEANLVTVTFDPGVHGSATGDLEQMFLIGGSAEPPTVTAESGWVFIGWAAPFTIVTEDVTVAAIYQLIGNCFY